MRKSIAIIPMWICTLISVKSLVHYILMYLCKITKMMPAGEYTETINMINFYL